MREPRATVPDRFQPQPAHTLWVQAYDSDGTLVHDLQAPGERFGFVTGVRERSGTVALGSLTGGYLALFSLSTG